MKSESEGSSVKSDYVTQCSEARTLVCVAIPFSRGSSQPRDWTQIFCIANGFFTSWATSEAEMY